MTISKSILIILISFLINHLVSAQQIQEFESSLGKERTEAINEIVTDFEKYLDSNFSGKRLNTKYGKYLEKLSTGNLSKEWKIGEPKISKYKKLELFDEFGIVTADSVWFDGDFVNWMSKDGEYEQSIVPTNKSISIDSLMIFVKDEIYTVMTVEGRFYIALETINEENPLANGLLDFRLGQDDKIFNIEWFADGLLKAKLDYSDYFVKRIIAIGTHKFE